MKSYLAELDKVTLADVTRMAPAGVFKGSVSVPLNSTKP